MPFRWQGYASINDTDRVDAKLVISYSEASLTSGEELGCTNDMGFTTGYRARGSIKLSSDESTAFAGNGYRVTGFCFEDELSMVADFILVGPNGEREHLIGFVSKQVDNLKFEGNLLGSKVVLSSKSASTSIHLPRRDSSIN